MAQVLCNCGNRLSNVAFPSSTVYKLLSNILLAELFHSPERKYLFGPVYQKAIEVWRCPDCERLLVFFDAPYITDCVPTDYVPIAKPEEESQSAGGFDLSASSIEYNLLADLSVEELYHFKENAMILDQLPKYLLSVRFDPEYKHLAVFWEQNAKPTYYVREKNRSG